MNTVAEIIRAIEALPKPELYKVVRWVEERRDEIEDAADSAFVATLESESQPSIPWDDVQAQLDMKP